MIASKQNCNAASLLLFLHRVIEVSGGGGGNYLNICLHPYRQVCIGRRSLISMNSSHMLRCMERWEWGGKISRSSLQSKCVYMLFDVLSTLWGFEPRGDSSYWRGLVVRSHARVYEYIYTCVFLVQVFKHYFEELEEESLRDNFVVVVRQESLLKNKYNLDYDIWIIYISIRKKIRQVGSQAWQFHNSQTSMISDVFKMIMFQGFVGQVSGFRISVICFFSVAHLDPNFRVLPLGK